ncbi:TPA: thiamine ABC transporter permease, partial [Raoultella ornithinolytica]
MAAPLRYPLILLAWGIMALIYLPVFPAIALMLAPAFRLACWQALFADPQIWQALAATLIST